MSIEPIKNNPNALSYFMGEQIYVFKPKQTDNSIDFLGSNNKQIVMLVHDVSNDYLSTTAEDMFVKLLAAVKLNMQDVAIINTAKQVADWEIIREKLNPQKVILWGVEPAFINLNVDKYSVLAANDIDVLYADGLDTITTNVELKRQLWEALQKMFL